MAQDQNDAARFFAQIEGMDGAQLAERGRIARVQQRWTETPWCAPAPTHFFSVADTTISFMSE